MNFSLAFYTSLATWIVCLLQMSSCSIIPKNDEIRDNLWNITWAHAVNSIKELETALNSDIMMLEADISMGFITGSSSETPIPIMAHPPATLSDLSFEDFISRTLSANEGLELKKGIKLDFKNISAVESSLQLLKSLNMNGDIQFPVWLNADILRGPVNSTSNPVDPTQFLNLTQTYYPSAILSLGWTTRYGGLVTSGQYEEEHLNEMADLILQNDLQVPPTFPVRAGLTAQTPIKWLLDLLNKIPGSTYTIWGSESDPLDMDKLREVVGQIGGDRLYIDLPFSLDSKGQS